MSGGTTLTEVEPEALEERPTFRARILDGELGGYVLLAPALLVLLALAIWPLVYSIGISFTNYELAASKALKFVGLANFRQLANDSIFLGSLRTTAKFLLVVVPAQLILGYVCARILVAAFGMIGSRFLRTCFIVPTMITSLAVGLFWAYMLDPLIGVGNYILAELHLSQQPWLTSPSSAFYTVAGIYLWQWVPFTALLIMAGLLSVPAQIFEAAAIDGARWYHRVFQIDIPLLLRVGAIAGILAVIEVIRLFDLIYGSTQGGPGTATLTNAVAIYRIGFQNFNTSYAAATSLLILVATILISQLFVRALREREA
jgi:multiple sugar transport system permease protein